MKFDIDYRQLNIEYNHKLKFEKTEHGFMLLDRTGIAIINAWNIEESGLFTINEIEQERKPKCYRVDMVRGKYTCSECEKKHSFIFQIEE